MDKLLYKYQEYRADAEREASPTNEAARGILDKMRDAARSAGIMGPETPSVMSPTGDLGKMPEEPKEPVSIRASTPQETQKAKAAPTAQEAYDPSQAGLVESSVQAAKSQGAQGLSIALNSSAETVYGTLDGLADIVSRKMRKGKPQVFEQLKNDVHYWAEHYHSKVSIDDYMTRVVGGLIGSGPALMEFAYGKMFAALRGFSEDGNIVDALYSASRRAAAGSVFKAAHRLDPAARIAAGTTYMTGESVVEQLGHTGTIDAGETAEAAGVGLGMMLSGGMKPGNKAGMRQRVDAGTWFETSKQGNEIYKAEQEGRIDTLTKDLAKEFYTADLMRGGTALNDTSMAVIDRVNLLRKGVDDWILADQGVVPDPAKDYAITGKTTTRAAEDGTYSTAIELYQGAKANTLVEEWMHREYDRLPASERRAVTRAYDAYKTGLAEGAPVMSEAEFYAKGATDKLFADQVAAQKAANRPAWLKAVDAGKTRWDSFVQAVRGVPGAKEDGSAPAMKPGETSENFQAAYHGSPYRFDKFTLDHIGSGEGAQAYGWGLYFAGNKEVAEYYRTALSHKAFDIGPEAERLGIPLNAGGRAEVIRQANTDADAATAAQRVQYANAASRSLSVEKIAELISGVREKRKGQLYEVTIPEPKTMLDWDKPLSEQPEQVKKALESIKLKMPKSADGFDMGGGATIRDNRKGQAKPGSVAPWVLVTGDSKFDLTQKDVDRMLGQGLSEMTGQGIYGRLVSEYGSQRAASEYLKSIGIPGLRYLDGTSRSAGEGSHNYVVFDDAQIAIDKTYYQVRPVDEIIYDPTPAPKLDQKYAEGGNTNLQRINSTEDVLKLINDVSRHNRETGAFEQATRGVRTWEETDKAARESETRVSDLLFRKEGQAGNAEQLLAARQLQAEFAAQTADLIARAKQTGEQADKDAAAKAWGVFSAVTAARDGMAAEAGRALNIMGRPVGDVRTQLISTAFADLARKHGGDRNADAIMDSILDMSRLNADGKLDIEEIARFARKVERASTFDMILEARYMAMLANPATHLKNILGNSIALMSQIPERAVAEGMGAVRGLFSKGAIDRVEVGETLAMMYGGIEGLRAGATAFVRAVRTGESTDPLGKLETTRRAITAENMGVDAESAWGKMIDFTAERLRTGNMLLGAEDDFFKAIGYSMELNARAHRAASAEGLKGQEFADRIQELVTNPPWDLQMQAMDFAHYSTFTNALGEGMTKLQGALGTDKTVTLKSGKTYDVPTGKLFRLAVPFFRTPANLVSYGLKRSPFAPFMPSVQQDLINGGAARDMAISRIALGSTLGFMAAQAASAGLITGGGPSDTKQKENLKAVGWQPYSVKVGDKWISYQAMEPFSMVIGAAADIALFDDYLEENERNNAAMMVAGAFSEAVTSKTFMQGLAGMIDVLQDPDRYGDRYAQQFAASFVPSPVKAIRRDVDPVVREVRTVSDALKNSLPGYSGDLYPRRNRYGEAVTMGEVWLSSTVDPVRKSEIKNAGNSPTYAIDKAIMENNVPIPRPGKVLHWEGVKVELTPEEYDTFQMLPRDLGLVEALQNVVASETFTAASGGPDGIKSNMIREVFGDFREQARYELVTRSQGVPGGIAERIEIEKLQTQMRQEAQQ